MALSKGSVWLLGVAFKRFPRGFTGGMHKDPDAPPCNMQNVRGLIKAGMLEEYGPGLFRITKRGIERHLSMENDEKKIPPELDRIADTVLKYKPKAKSKAAKRRVRRMKRAEKDQR